MDPNADRPTDRPVAPDDDELGELVRASVDGWTMPPQRLDQPTWRDRVAGGSSRTLRGWRTRLAASAFTAVAATVVVAFVAVFLTARPPGPGIAIGPSGSPTVGPGAVVTPSPAGSALPELFVAGALPVPAQVMVRNGSSYQIADLSTGRLVGSAIRSYDGATTMLARPGGGWLCVCTDLVEFGGSRPTGLDVVLETIDAAGRSAGRTVIRELRGDGDPGTGGSAQPALAFARGTGTADGRLAFVGWTVRQGAAGWEAGIDVVDTATATVVSSIPLPLREPAEAGGRPSTRLSPAVSLAPSGDAVLVTSEWFAENGLAIPPAGTEHWTAPFDGRAIGALRPAGVSVWERCEQADRGLIDDASYYALCWTTDGRFMVERTGADGTLIDQTAIPGMTAGFDGGTLHARHDDTLFLWDAKATTLSRFDLRSAKVDSVAAVAAAPANGPLDAFAAVGRGLGRWIAPPALAKVRLGPGVVVTPDGARVYAIGIDEVAGGGEGASLGVFAFDARTLAAVGHWQPTADYVSLSVSADGRYVYAAGQSGRDAAGNETRSEASITVFDANDDLVALIAGRLGFGFLEFPGGTVR